MLLFVHQAGFQLSFWYQLKFQLSLAVGESQTFLICSVQDEPVPGRYKGGSRGKSRETGEGRVGVVLKSLKDDLILKGTK